MNTDIRQKRAELEYVSADGEPFFKLANVDEMEPFFMSIVSDSDHWFFISSNGGLSAGRKNTTFALFPYDTEDKITDSYDTTGDKTIIWVSQKGVKSVWEPFSERFTGKYNTTRNLYKSAYGNKIVFEEINHDLGLIYKYRWSSSDEFGFIRRSEIINTESSGVEIRILDGIQNIMPHGVDPHTQTNSSNLVHAYKRSELSPVVGIGIFALSALIVDRAEPSEALKANIVWSLGLENPTYLLSSKQIDKFRKTREVTPEEDVKGAKGSYFLVKDLTLKAGSAKSWLVVANVNQSVSSIRIISAKIKNSLNLVEEINRDIDAGTARLKHLISSSDGVQVSADKQVNARHYSNTLFNIMRGGVFDNGYQIEKWDFEKYLKKASVEAYQRNKSLLEALPATFQVFDLHKRAEEINDKDFFRLAVEYLPLKFSRRHGDPSRPWNKFSINMKDEVDGTKILDYEGNWRDIFQNWEALAFSYPEFIAGMIFKFLNAGTFDGYNPYRVTKGGFDWEVADEKNPWSYIGYWGDHQIIYLQKFLEFIDNHKPDKLKELFGNDCFVYANVPYRIKNYQDIVKNPKDTIEFEKELDAEIRTRIEKYGADGALLTDSRGNIHRVNFLEKILATSLAKLSNYIPEGGIWMNTQRPEWNDANNALVGNGVSMVTLYYLRRFLHFLRQILKNEQSSVRISSELVELFNEVKNVYVGNLDLLHSRISDQNRKAITDALGVAADNYRTRIYENSFNGAMTEIAIDEIKKLFDAAQKHVEHTIRANRREDGMYHAYNIMSMKSDGISISYLDEMLEGQVGVLSSGLLTSREAIGVLDGLKSGRLFRADQYSYILYPNKDLPKFLVKNTIPESKVKSSELLSRLVQDGDLRIIEKDIEEKYHFNGDFNNARFLSEGLDKLADYEELVAGERALVLSIYEEVFNHKAFTGRSGTFFGFEGLGSIYWHMVSKLLLAVMECSVKAVHEGESHEITERLLEHFYEILIGIGIHKSPELYGAFPIDPYSHTPMGRGVQQPGMTGQVKEDIIGRIGELGVFVRQGQVHFKPFMLRASEFLSEVSELTYTDLAQQEKSIKLTAGSLGFTYCQVPVVYKISEEESVAIRFSNGNSEKLPYLLLTKEHSESLFRRTGDIAGILVHISKSTLR